MVHTNLGIALADRGDLDGAIAKYHSALRLNPNDAWAFGALGIACRDQGRFVEALDNIRRGHELGSGTPGFPYRSAQLLRECERLVQLDGRLDAVLRGEEKSKDVSETIEFAWLCQGYKHRNAAAARLYQEALAAPKGETSKRALCDRIAAPPPKPERGFTFTAKAD